VGWCCCTIVLASRAGLQSAVFGDGDLRSEMGAVHEREVVYVVVRMW
jgi:hypothetical protein